MKFRRVSWLRNVLVGSVGTESPPIEKTSGKKSLLMVSSSPDPPKFRTNHAVLVINPAELVTLHVRVEAFTAPSKLAITEPLGGLTKVANARPTKKFKYVHEQVLNTIITFSRRRADREQNQ